jgi:serine/threonine protein kinase
MHEAPRNGSASPDGSGPWSTPLVPGDPRRLGKYRVLGRLGADSRGMLYVGESRAGVPVALRVPRPEWLVDARNRAGLARSLVASRRAAGVNGAFRIMDVDINAPVPYVASEFSTGAPVRVVVTQNGPFGPRATKQLATQILAVLDALHTLGVEHRNVNPGTVIVNGEEARLADLGFGLPVGDDPDEAWRFAGPEQLRGEPGGAAADLFGWATTVAFAASGRAPFDWLSRAEFLGLHDLWSADLSTLASPLRELVRDCLDPNPRVRPTARESLDRLGDTSTPSSGVELLARIPGRRSPT